MSSKFSVMVSGADSSTGVTSSCVFSGIYGVQSQSEIMSLSSTVDSSFVVLGDHSVDPNF